MSGEQAPTRKKLLPEGEREFIIKSCEPSVSKGGNDMFVIELEDVETKYIDKIYPLAVPKKRWFLKTILAACGIPASADGVYDWETRDILEQHIIGVVEHEENVYINRDGNEIKGKQHKIVEVKPCEEVAWDQDMK